jgi:glycosyltransferase involved in cell wall biosynthesis
MTKRTREMLADADLRRRMGVAAARRAERFSWESTGARFEELLDTY